MDLKQENEQLRAELSKWKEMAMYARSKQREYFEIIEELTSERTKGTDNELGNNGTLTNEIEME